MSQLSREALLAEAKRRRLQKAVVDYGTLAFGEQKSFIEDSSELVAACTGRQAGKTDGLALKMLRTGSQVPRSLIPYITLSRPAAKRIMWPKLREWDRKLNLGARWNGTDLTMTLQNGSVIMLGGANDEAEIERYRGITVPLICIDEAQAFRGFLEMFIREILLPALWAKEGQLVMTGTPNASGLGYFARACNTEHDQHVVDVDGNSTWNVHHWTGLQNPHMPNIKARWEKEWRAFGIDKTSAAVQREYFGQWIRDDSSLVYRIPDMCIVNTMPAGNWEYYLGVDVGHKDLTAFVVLAYDNRQRLAVVVESYTIAEAIPTTIMVEVDRLEARYPFVLQVMDPGGGGKFIIEEYNRLHGGRLNVAEKRGKHAFIEQLNGSLAAGRTLVLEGANHDLLEEARLLQWDWGRTVRGAELLSKGSIRIDDRTNDHLLDAFLYAWRAASRPAAEDEYNTLDPSHPGWAEAEAEARFLKAIEPPAVDPWEQMLENEDILW